MIRPVETKDIPQITEIYNRYILNGVESFETEALTEERMGGRIAGIYPDFHITWPRKRVGWSASATPIRGKSEPLTPTLSRLQSTSVTAQRAKARARR